MTLHLTKEILVAVYELLRETPPFRPWNLPEPEDVRFRVGNWTVCGYYRRMKGKHEIGISSRRNGHLNTLILTMAHEMVHLHEGHTRCDRGKGEHSAAFKKWAAQVCKVHGFDPRFF